MPEEFKTWRGIDPEEVLPPTVRAVFHAHGYVFPTFEFELNSAAFHLLKDLLDDARRRAGEYPSEELLALVEAFEAIGG